MKLPGSLRGRVALSSTRLSRWTRATRPYANKTQRDGSRTPVSYSEIRATEIEFSAPRCRNISDCDNPRTVLIRRNFRARFLGRYRDFVPIGKASYSQLRVSRNREILISAGAYYYRHT